MLGFSWEENEAAWILFWLKLRRLNGNKVCHNRLVGTKGLKMMDFPLQEGNLAREGVEAKPPKLPLHSRRGP